MKHRTLTRITKYKTRLITSATLSLILGLLLIMTFALTLTPLTTIKLGSLSLTVADLNSFTTPMIILAATFILIALIIIGLMMLDKRKLEFIISENSIEVNSRKASYIVELNNVDYLHLLRLPDTRDYGFRDVVALYEHKNFSWTVIGPQLQDKNDKKTAITTIQQELITQFEQLKSQELRNQLLAGQAIVFPYLAEHLSTGVDTSQQEDFDRELILEQDKGNLPVSQIMPTGAEVSWQGHLLTVDGIEVDMYQIADVRLHRFTKKIKRKKESLSWNYGQKMTLIDKNKVVLATIYLPSLLNGDIFLELLLETVNIKKNKSTNSL